MASDEARGRAWFWGRRLANPLSDMPETCEELGKILRERDEARAKVGMIKVVICDEAVEDAGARVCRTCDGKRNVETGGAEWPWRTCPECNGTGREESDEQD